MPIVTLAPDVYCVGVRTGTHHIRHRHPDRARDDVQLLPREGDGEDGPHRLREAPLPPRSSCATSRKSSRVEADYVIVNHSEPDHAGALVELLERNPAVTVLLSRVAKTFVDNLVNAGFPFRIVGDNDELSLGGRRSGSSTRRSCTGPTRSSRIWRRTRSSSPAISSGPTTPVPTPSTTIHEPLSARKAFEFLRDDHAAVQGAHPQGVRAGEGLPRSR